MAPFKQKYQLLLTIALLTAYIFGNFGTPLFEGVHFLLHLGGHSAPHSFQSHHLQHTHTTLLVINDLIPVDSQKNTPFNQNSVDKSKKVLQIKEQTAPSTIIETVVNISQPIYFLKLKSQFFLENHSPPPQV